MLRQLEVAGQTEGQEDKEQGRREADTENLFGEVVGIRGAPFLEETKAERLRKVRREEPGNDTLTVQHPPSKVPSGRFQHLPIPLPIMAPLTGSAPFSNGAGTELCS